MQLKKVALFISVLVGAIIGVALVNQPQQPQPLVQLVEDGASLKLSTLYGSTTITEPVLIELIKSPAFQRLGKVRQYGVVCYARPNEPEYTRLQHSLGVFFLTRAYGAPLSEQIAALLHDVSHTVFSHVGDRLFNSNYYLYGNNSYQDNIHEWYLEKSGVMDILRRYDMAHACSSEAKRSQLCFEQPSPDLCADRIEYNIAGGFIDGMLTQAEITAMMKSLHFYNGHWFFDDLNLAKKFAHISVQLSESRWGAAWSIFIDQAAAAAIQRAVTLGLVTHDDVHFSTDDEVWAKLTTSSDPEIMTQLGHIKNYKEHLKLAAPSPETIHLHGKFSGTNPLVMTEAGLQRIRDVDTEFNAQFEMAKTTITAGYHAKLKITPTITTDMSGVAPKFA